MSKREKQGRIWTIILLLAPLVLMGGTLVWDIFTDRYDVWETWLILMAGIIYAMLSLISFAVFLGKGWAHLLLILISLLTILGLYWEQAKYYPDQSLNSGQLGEIFYSIVFYILPAFLLFLPAPNAFLRYQREKASRHLDVLEHQLNQIGKDE
ncbi:MAG: hypothetical protein AAFN10_14885 [Bacteroidota bacterium]